MSAPLRLASAEYAISLSIPPSASFQTDSAWTAAARNFLV